MLELVGAKAWQGDRTIKYIQANIMNEKGGDLNYTQHHGFFTKPRDRNSTIGYWKKRKMNTNLLLQSQSCITEYEAIKSTVLNIA